MKILINPPPKSGKCWECEQVKPLTKVFRENNGSISARWLCRECLMEGK